MTDAELGKLVYDAIDDAGFDATLLERVRDAVTSAIAAGAPDGDLRDDHAAGDRLDKSLAAHGEDAARASTAAKRATTSEDSERRANAFRAMAGVRV